MFLVFILIIVLLTLVEISFRNKERFDNYDLQTDGDIYIRDARVGIREDPKNDKLLSVDGTLHVKDQFCIDDVCFTKNKLQKIKRLPLFNKDKLCLKDDTGNPICIDEKMLGMLSGHRTIRFKNARDETLIPIKIKHHGFESNYWQHHDDNDDTSNYSGFRFPETRTNLYYHEGKSHFETFQFAPYDYIKNKYTGEFTMIPAKKPGDYPSIGADIEGEGTGAGTELLSVDYGCRQGEVRLSEEEQKETIIET